MLYTPGDYYCVDITSHGLVEKICDDAIKYFTNSDYCHTFLITSTDGDIVEARPHGGVDKGHIDEYKGMKMVQSSTVLTNAQRLGIVHYAESLVGKYTYNFAGVCLLGLYLKGVRNSLVEKEVASDAAEDKRTFCSQLAAMAGRAYGVTEWMCGLDYATLVTPADLALLAIK